jgi:hypothetical protein
MKRRSPSLMSKFRRTLFATGIVLGVFSGIVLTAEEDEDFRFPPVENLSENAMMPDPFLKPDGTRVASLNEWPEQREYLKALLEHYLYGTVPPKPTPEELSFTFVSEEPFIPGSKINGLKQTYQIELSRNGLTHSFLIILWRPTEGKRYPTLINNYPEHSNSGVEDFSKIEAIRRGYAVVEFDRNDVAPDDKTNANRKRGVFPLYPEYDFHSIAAWAWAYQPIIDVLDEIGVIDMEKIIATGHSRGGQAATAAGIFDERIALVAPSTGGPWSLGSYRQRDPNDFRGDMDYPVLIQRQFPHWYHPRYVEFIGRQDQLPWDVTTLTALIAPRPLINVNSTDDGINNGLAHEVGVRSGRKIYAWWGAEDLCRIHWRGVTNQYGQKGHDQGPEEFLAIYDFADEYFFDKPRGPSSFNRAPNSDTWRHDPEKYPLMIDWDIPASE